MKNIKFLSVFCAVVLVLGFMAGQRASALTEPSTDSARVVMLDAATGNVLFEKNADEKAYPASLTKVMTVMLAIEAIQRGEVGADDEVTCPNNIGYDLVEDGSSANIVAGEKMTLKNLMYCALVASANEACNAIADYISGSIPEFIKLMNARAEELGCTNTHFANTHGLPNSEHYTTAADMAKIAYEASKYDLFMEISNTKKITIPATNSAPARDLSNTNGLINPDSPIYPGYTYEYAVGVKTGHTEAAGYCLISTAVKEDVSLLCVVMGGKDVTSASGVKHSSFTDSIALYDWGFANFSYREVLKMTDLVEEVPVSMGADASFVTVHPQTAIRVLSSGDDNFEDYEQKVTIYSKENGEELIAPVKADQVLGEIQIIRDGVVYGTSPLVASSSIDLSYSKLISSKITNTLKNPLVIIFLIIVIGLIAGYVYLVIRYRRSKKQYIKEHPNAASAHGVRSASGPKARSADKQKSRNASKHVPAAHARKRGTGSNGENVSATSANKTEPQPERDYYEEFFGRK